MIDPRPAAEHATTAAIAWPRKLPWPWIAGALLGAAVVIFGFVELALHGPPAKGRMIWIGRGSDRSDGTWGTAALELAAPVIWTVACAWAAWYGSPRRRAMGYLRRYPWTEWRGRARRTSLGGLPANALVELEGEDGTAYELYTRTMDDDWPAGEQMIWFAGEPGKAGAVSLREGDCVSIAYRYTRSRRGAA